MKKALVFAALTMMSASAFASKARVAALGGDIVTVADDVQEVFKNPAEMFGFGDMLTIEYGGTPEGGFFRSNGDTKYGIYFGNRSASFATITGQAQTVNAAALAEQNPFELFYGSKMGDSAWGLSFKYSQGEDKVAQAKVNTMGLRAGYNTDAFEVYVGLGLAGKTEVANSVSAQSDMSIRVGGEYFIGDSIAYADVQQSGGKLTPAPGAAEIKASRMVYTLGYESKIRSETAHFFYGVKLASEETKADPAKNTSMKLPLYAGVEADAASWLALRGFVQQSILLNSAKNDPGNGGAATVDSTGLNDTSAGLGASLKFGKLSIDGTMSAATTGTLNTDTLLATTSLNYWF